MQVNQRRCFTLYSSHNHSETVKLIFIQWEQKTKWWAEFRLAKCTNHLCDTKNFSTGTFSLVTVARTTIPVSITIPVVNLPTWTFPLLLGSAVDILLSQSDKWGQTAVVEAHLTCYYFFPLVWSSSPEEGQDGGFKVPQQLHIFWLWYGFISILLLIFFNLEVVLSWVPALLLSVLFTFKPSVVDDWESSSLCYETAELVILALRFLAQFSSHQPIIQSDSLERLTTHLW